VPQNKLMATYPAGAFDSSTPHVKQTLVEVAWVSCDRKSSSTNVAYAAGSKRLAGHTFAEHLGTSRTRGRGLGCPAAPNVTDDC
jgi:hypothetical protein